MVSKNYRKEVGLYESQKNLPKPVAYAVLAAVLGVAAISATHVAGEAKKFHAGKQSVAPAAAAAAAQ
jgi:hypothetical protein